MVELQKGGEEEKKEIKGGCNRLQPKEGVSGERGYVQERKQEWQGLLENAREKGLQTSLYYFFFIDIKNLY